MRNSTQKIIASFLSVIILSNALYFALPDRASAQVTSADGGATEVYKQCGIQAAANWVAAKVSGMVTDAVPKPAVSTNNGEASWQKFFDDAWSCLKALWNVLLKIAFNKFKKRLLDRLTDDVVGWISGVNGKPQFVGNFGDVLKSTADAALGDTVQALGAGKLCNTKLSVELRLNLVKPTPDHFSQNVSCTLSNVVGNISAFADNFKNGGWIGYQELNGLQNNKYGLQLLAFDELDSRTTQKTDAAKTEAAGSNGFLSTKLCKKWSIIGHQTLADGTAGPDMVIGTFPSANDNNLIDPNKPPAKIPDNYAPSSACSGTTCTPNTTNALVCKAEDQVITTPGQTLATVLGNSFDHDPKALINADDLTPYLSAIFDAAINRLAKEGVRGLSRASVDLFSQSSRGLNPTPYSTSTRDRLYAGYGSSLLNTTIQTTPTTGASSDTIAQITSALATTTKEIAAIKAEMLKIQTLYTSLLATTTQLSACETQKTPAGATCPTTSVTLTTINAAPAALSTANTSLNSINASVADATSIINDPNASQSDLLKALGEALSTVSDAQTTLTNLSTTEASLTAIDTKSLNTQYITCSAVTPPAKYICPQ